MFNYYHHKIVGRKLFSRLANWIVRLFNLSCSRLHPSTLKVPDVIFCYITFIPYRFCYGGCKVKNIQLFLRYFADDYCFSRLVNCVFILEIDYS
jgi:hypothetical protein